MPPGKQKGGYDLSVTVGHTASQPVPATLLVPIPGVAVALVPSRLPHKVAIGRTSRWAFAMPAFSPLSAFSFALSPAFVLAFPTLISSIRSTASWLSKVGFKLLMMWPLVFRQTDRCRSMWKTDLPVVTCGFRLLVGLARCKFSPLRLAESNQILGDGLGVVGIRQKVTVSPSIYNGYRGLCFGLMKRATYTENCPMSRNTPLCDTNTSV